MLLYNLWAICDIFCQEVFNIICFDIDYFLALRFDLPIKIISARENYHTYISVYLLGRVYIFKIANLQICYSFDII